MNIEIKPMQRKVSGKLVDWIEFPQRQVLIDGRRVAYCGSKPGMPINFRRELGEDIKRAVKAKVEDYLQGPAGRLVNPAPIIEDEEGDNDD